MTEDPLIVLDRRRNPTDALRGMLGGRAAFLAGGGPSANHLELELLRQRGCWALAVNNMAAHPRLRANAMVCADPPSKFSHCVWLDPGVMKFIPIPKLTGSRASLRRKLPDGTFVDLGKRVDECPNVWAYQRRSWLVPDDTFFTTEDAGWGNHQSGVDRTGEEKTVCTLLLGIRILHYLGASKIYLIGVDWDMASGYAFPQGRNEDAVQSNNAQFRVAGGWLMRMQANGVFDRAGLAIYNCNRYSGLAAFPHVPFEAAVADACNGIEAWPDLTAWYEKK